MYPHVNLIQAFCESSGSIWMTKADLLQACKRSNIAPSGIMAAVNAGIVKHISFDGEEYFSLRDYDLMESQAAHDAVRILCSNSLKKHPADVVDKMIDISEQKAGIKLHTQQREAVRCMIKNPLCVITGGPGTGKTCTLSVAVKVLEMLYQGIDVRFTAPTGKAAGRINESLNICTARTIQRELKIGLENRQPAPFAGDILIVDEVSMLDMETASKLFKSIPSGKRLILVGDTQQLPSVGFGAVLRDLIDSEVIPYVILSKTFRQAEESALMANIIKTKQGDPELVYDRKEFPIFTANPDREKAVTDLCRIYLEETRIWGNDNVCCLLPFRRAGMLCSNTINSKLQNMINPYSMGKSIIRTTLDNGAPVSYMTGDPVMQLVNREECANGDVGKVVFIEGTSLFADFGNGNIVRYNSRELPENLSLAYSMSINKSQGSEYPCVIVCMTMEHASMLTRNMLYTGITRARKKCVLYCDKKAIEISMQHTAMYRDSISGGRTTFLAEKLKYAKEHIFTAA